MAFTGFPTEAIEFYEQLAADNSRTFWQANKQRWVESVKQSMEALADELDDFGPFHMFRPYNDGRFSKNKPPYKTQLGAYGELEGGTGYYVQFSADGLMAGAGYYAMAKDQLKWPEDDAVRLSGKAMGERIKVAGALGGMYIPHCARIHPARLVRGLARAVESLGVKIHENTLVTEISAAGNGKGPSAVTERGTVRAAAVLRATEGFTANLAQSHRDWLPMNSSMIVTQPLDSKAWERNTGGPCPRVRVPPTHRR